MAENSCSCGSVGSCSSVSSAYSANQTSPVSAVAKVSYMNARSQQSGMDQSIFGKNAFNKNTQGIWA